MHVKLTYFTCKTLTYANSSWIKNFVVKAVNPVASIAWWKNNIFILAAANGYKRKWFTIFQLHTNQHKSWRFNISTTNSTRFSCIYNNITHKLLLHAFLLTKHKDQHNWLNNCQAIITITVHSMPVHVSHIHTQALADKHSDKAQFN